MILDSAVSLPICEEIQADFIVTATGSGMSGYSIQHGDSVFIRQQDTAETGDIVLISVDGELTLRWYCENDGVICFVPGDRRIPSIIADPATMPQIIGKAVGLMRSFERCEGAAK